MWIISLQVYHCLFVHLLTFIQCKHSFPFFFYSFIFRFFFFFCFIIILVLFFSSCIVHSLSVCLCVCIAVSILYDFHFEYILLGECITYSSTNLIHSISYVVENGLAMMRIQEKKQNGNVREEKENFCGFTCIYVRLGISSSFFFI